MDYAIIRAGGKQVKVSQGDIVALERFAGEPGDSVTFGEVLLVKSGEQTKIGEPLVKGATVKVVVLEQARDKKVITRKFRRRKGYLRIRGHRQYFTRVRVESISA
jgi:large subunit ribosomal protein L21